MKATMTRQQFIGYVGISASTLDRLLREGKVGSILIGRRRLFTEEHARDLLARFERPQREFSQFKFQRRRRQLKTNPPEGEREGAYVF